MMAELEFTILGTGGGRFAMITQKRRTAGIRILSEDVNIHLDPGPGALIHSLKMGLDPQKIQAVLVSHAHPDHYNDAEILVEAMTRGMTRKRGLLAATRSVLYGNKNCGPAVSKYHQQMPKELVELRLGVDFDVGEVKAIVTKAVHSDPDAVGFRFETSDVGDVGYTSDTEFFDGIGKVYRGVRLLLLSLLRPSSKPWRGHITTDDAIKIVREVDPELVVITHFGMGMIFAGPRREAERIGRESGVHTVAAKDGMRLRVGEEITVGIGERKRKGLEEFA
ncbi:MAG: MBL fold metallo-hydrolase [Candidatus Bathyarchaeota archaeon]|nr:MAG: MBL fold metallo-hydrolase [Candidatus Bathyarchaeota archaeon]